MFKKFNAYLDLLSYIEWYGYDESVITGIKQVVPKQDIFTHIVWMDDEDELKSYDWEEYKESINKEVGLEELKQPLTLEGLNPFAKVYVQFRDGCSLAYEIFFSEENAMGKINFIEQEKRGFYKRPNFLETYRKFNKEVIEDITTKASTMEVKTVDCPEEVINQLREFYYRTKNKGRIIIYVSLIMYEYLKPFNLGATSFRLITDYPLQDKIYLISEIGLDSKTNRPIIEVLGVISYDYGIKRD